MKWEFADITNDAGQNVTAQAPVIISASRSTDIPTFYSDWFSNAGREGTYHGKIHLTGFHCTYHLVKRGWLYSGQRTPVLCSRISISWKS